MKYKKIITDKKINRELKKHNRAKIARKIGVSNTYLYEAISEKYVVTESFYKKLLNILAKSIQNKNE